MSRFTRTNILLLLAVVLLAAVPLLLGLGQGEEPFSGADSRAESAITEDHPTYEPWFSSVFEPPSGEVESGLFAVQAALGAGVLGYCLGVVRTRRRNDRRTTATEPGPTT
ncbi:energy-coupling factor ABC transporter substrate-binding protein [Actinomycetospora cinnamomea]|uniref:Cobalt transport protein CbiN n=1 Tax=Actinomycetospora cinnamomea TaxID=663609 RepID=A0A2U1EAD8_9PSEU|nr:energy-coupling factor ABC transporter substrate-binding protein [Actinomycetospora cinnamomea]PVY96913.1 cobalt/nickel transport protein [Actinomycetospora cinnamomea]